MYYGPSLPLSFLLLLWLWFVALAADHFVDLAWLGSASEVEDPVLAFLQFAMADVDWE